MPDTSCERTIAFSPETMEKLRRKAEEEHISVSDLVHAIVIEYFSKE